MRRSHRIVTLSTTDSCPLICATNNSLTRSMTSHNSFNCFVISSILASQSTFFLVGKHLDRLLGITLLLSFLVHGGEAPLAPLSYFKLVKVVVNVVPFFLLLISSCMAVSRTCSSVFGALPRGTMHVQPCFMTRSHWR